jgi:hypothetical protein
VAQRIGDRSQLVVVAGVRKACRHGIGRAGQARDAGDVS